MNEEKDDLFEEAKAFAIERGKLSGSSLQRKFKLGYNRAGRIMDQLEAAGVVSEFKGDVDREVLILKPVVSKEACKHEKFECHSKVGRLTEEEGADPYRFVFECKVKCVQCNTFFEFIGVPCGDSPEHPMANADFTVLRAPIRPETGTIATSAYYQVKPNKPTGNPN